VARFGSRSKLPKAVDGYRSDARARGFPGESAAVLALVGRGCRIGKHDHCSLSFQQLDRLPGKQIVKRHAVRTNKGIRLPRAAILCGAASNAISSSAESIRVSPHFLRLIRKQFWALDCSPWHGSTQVRITVKGMLIFCSLLAGLIAAEVVAAPTSGDSLSIGTAPDVLWLADVVSDHAMALAS